MKIKTEHKNLWNAVKAVLWGNFVALNACLRKEERTQINDLSLYLKKI